MSTISAGTTSNTALKQTGDTTGNLVLQTNGTTTAMTISSAQIVSLTSSLALLGSTSGSVSLTAPAVAGTQSYTLPTAQPTANGQALTATTAGVMSWATAGGGSPGGSNTQVQYNNSSAFGGISGFTTDGTRVTASTTIGVGGATPSTSGSGVTFPATQSASSDVNTLDDYEEGTWTPVLSDGTNNATMTGTVGRYVKIGSQVSLFAFVTTTSLGSVSGNLRITGLPFNIGSNMYGAVAVGYGQNLIITAGQSVGVYAGPGNAYLDLRVWNATTGTSQLQGTNWNGSNGGIIFSFTYNT